MPMHGKVTVACGAFNTSLAPLDQYPQRAFLAFGAIVRAA